MTKTVESVDCRKKSSCRQIVVVLVVCLAVFCELGLVSASINERFTNSFYVRLKRSDLSKPEVDALAAKHGMHNWGKVRTRTYDVKFK